MRTTTLRRLAAAATTLVCVAGLVVAAPATAARPVASQAPAAQPAEVVTTALRLDGPREVQHDLDLDVVVATGSDLLFQAPVGVDLRGQFVSGRVGSEDTSRVPLIALPSGLFRARLTGWPRGQAEVSIRIVTAGPRGHVARNWVLRPVIVASAPAVPAIDLGGPGTTSETHLQAADLVAQQRGGKVTYTAPPGVALEPSSSWIEVRTPLGAVRDDDGYDRSVADDGLSLTFTLPTTYLSGHPIAGGVTMQVVTHLSHPGGGRLELRTQVRTTGTGAPPTTTVAVVGADRALYVRRDGAGYRDLGGVLTGSPVVARLADGRDLYLAQSPNRGVYARTDALPWTRLSPPGTVCLDPDAEASVRTQQLTVACRAGDGALLLARFTVPVGGLPSAATFVRRGGSLAVGPGVALDPVTDVATVLVVGTSRHATGNVWEHREGAAAGTFLRRSLTCSAAPAVSTAATADNQLVGCRGARGDLVVSYAYRHWYEPEGAWSDSTLSFGGQMVGRPGVTPAWSGREARYTVAGANQAVYQTVSCCTGFGTWKRLPGTATAGGGFGSAGVLAESSFPCVIPLCLGD